MLTPPKWEPPEDGGVTDEALVTGAEAEAVVGTPEEAGETVGSAVETVEREDTRLECGLFLTATPLFLEMTSVIPNIAGAAHTGENRTVAVERSVKYFILEVLQRIKKGGKECKCLEEDYRQTKNMKLKDSQRRECCKRLCCKGKVKETREAS
jgi:hypothetical protein